MDDIVTLLQAPELLQLSYTDLFLLCKNAADEIERLQTTNDAFIRVIENCMNEIERLRQLGDTLAYWGRQGAGKEMFSAVHAWEEAPRD